jgi:hypothetical protein
VTAIATTHRNRRQWTGAVLALHAVVFVALAAWSWRRWPDPLIDFGRELYVPWQITRGRLLYRDLASLFGPFSPYVNALWFKLFGVSLITLAACNLAIAAAAFWGIHHLLAISTGRAAASAATVTALVQFGFSQYIDVGNYNFATPYSHEATHGLALGVAAIVALHHAIAARRTPLFAVSGLCFGLVFLTKPEVFVAAAAAVGTGAVVAIWLGPERGGRWADALAFALGAAAGPGAAVAALHFGGGMTISEAARSCANAWTVLLSTPIARNAFYLRIGGFDQPLLSVWRMVAAGTGALATVAAAVAVTCARPRSLLARLGVFALQCAIPIGAAVGFAAFSVPRALPLFTIGILAIAMGTIVRQRRDREAALRALPLAMWSAFALALLAKMLLNARLYHYGFYLALPALTVAVAALVGLVPDARWLSGTRTCHARRVRVMMAGIVAMIVVPQFALANLTYRAKTLPIGSGGDRFFAGDTPEQWQGRAVRQALEWINAHADRQATLAVFPEGVMINYLSRRDAPTKYFTAMPPEVAAFGEPAIVAALDAHPPDFVLLVHRNTGEYGVPPFGADAAYGRAILSWVDRRYVVAATIAGDPLMGDPGIEIRRRADRGRSD